MIIYAPYIADIIPAFTDAKITIPFTQNPALSIEQVKHFQLQVKDYVSSELLGTIKANLEGLTYDRTINSGEVVFLLSNFCAADPDTSVSDITNPGQYYKFQLGFSDDEGWNDAKFYAFSTASLGRCLGADEDAPTVEIKGRQNRTLSTTNLNVGSSSFTGIHKSKLVSESLHSYRFMLVNRETNTTIEDTGWLLHNADNDIFNTNNTERYATHSYKLYYELDEWIHYSIIFETKTINGYYNKVECTIVKQGELPMAFEGALIASQDKQAKDNGYVLLTLEGRPVKGSFELQRTSDKKYWYTLTTFDITKLSDFSNFSWKDWSVEQGVTYTYAIRQYAREQYSERLEAVPIQIEFDSLFLSDGKRQLRIEYNPKVSSIKDVILESKMDTIGSRYPFFFRNDIVRYKELPISGLISYHMDNDELFMTNSELGLDDEVDKTYRTLIEPQETVVPPRPRTTSLVGYNFEAERKFKLEVMNWLNNGQPKLFRSPAEGNYIVRMMGVSLSPNEQLGRMLHSFSSTAYEIMDYNMLNLQEYKIIDLDYLKDPDPKPTTTTIQFSDMEFNDNNECNIITFINGTRTLESKYDAPRIRSGTISNIIWHSVSPSKDESIIIDDRQFCNNNTGILSTPSGLRYTNLIVKKPVDDINYGSSITFTYLPDLTVEEGEDTFEYMVATSDDVLFTVPSGQCLRLSFNGNNGALFVKDVNADHILCDNIYKTYTLVVKKDENYSGPVVDPYAPGQESTTDIPETYKLRFFTKDYYSGNKETILSTVDCSDGQIRYYTGVEQDVFFEKGPGLILDIYACVGGMREFNSSILGQFPIGAGVLGG